MQILYIGVACGTEMVEEMEESNSGDWDRKLSGFLLAQIPAIFNKEVAILSTEESRYSAARRSSSCSLWRSREHRQYRKNSLTYDLRLNEAIFGLHQVVISRIVLSLHG